MWARLIPREVSNPGIANEKECGIGQHTTPSELLRWSVKNLQVSNRCVLTVTSIFLAVMNAVARSFPATVEIQMLIGEAPSDSIAPVATSFLAPSEENACQSQSTQIKCGAVLLITTDSMFLLSVS